MATSLSNEPGITVEDIEGAKGEFTVLVDGQEVIRKTGDDLPSLGAVVAAVRYAEPAMMATPY